MKAKKLSLVAAVLGLAVLASGCVIVVGNKGNLHGNGTVGQQLVDLKKARDAGVITQDEYEAQKARLLSEEKKK